MHAAKGASRLLKVTCFTNMLTRKNGSIIFKWILNRVGGRRLELVGPE